MELQITSADRSTTTRSRTLREPTAHTPVLQQTLYAVTARVSGLVAAERAFVQLTFDATTEDRRVLEPVIDRANRRWGGGTVHLAALTKAKAATGPVRRSRHRPAPVSRRCRLVRPGSGAAAGWSGVAGVVQEGGWLEAEEVGDGERCALGVAGPGVPTGPAAEGRRVPGGQLSALAAGHDRRRFVGGVPVHGVHPL